jgi:hypothetical protein
MPDQFVIARGRPLAVPDPLHALVILTLSLWTIVVWSPLLAFPQYEVYGIGLGLLGPVVAAPIMLFAPPRLAPSARLGLIWTTLVAAAVIAGLLVVELPLVAVVIPVFVPLAVLCWRFPVVSMFVLLVLAGGTGSLNAYLDFPVQRLIDVILPGLWGGVLWGLVMRRREYAFIFWPGVVLVATYIVITFFEAFVADSLILGLKAFRLSAWLMAVALLLGYAGWPWKTYRRIAKCVVFVSLLVGAYAVYRWIVGPSADEFVKAQQLVGPFNIVDGELKLFAPFSSRHQLGGFCAEVVPFLLIFAISTRGFWRFPALAGAGLCVAALMGSDVRAAFAAMVLGFLATLAGYQLSRAYRGLHLGTTAVVVLVLLCGGLFLFTQTTGGSDSGKQRYQRILDPTNDESFAGRLQKWSTAIPEIEEHPWGQGLGTAGITQKTSGKYLNSASIDLEGGYLNVAFQQGWAVMGLYILAVLALALSLLKRGIETLSRERAALALGAFGSLVVFMVLNAISGYAEGLPTIMPWVIAGLAIAAFSRNWGDQPPQPSADGFPASRANPQNGARTSTLEPSRASAP